MDAQFMKIASQITDAFGNAGQAPLPLAMAYIPPQIWTTVYNNLDEALADGTIFPALNLPFEGGRAK